MGVGGRADVAHVLVILKTYLLAHIFVQYVF